MEPYHIYTEDSQAPIPFSLLPRRAKEAVKWIVKRQSATDAPNLFLTTDFQNFKRLTDLQPQKSTTG